MARSQGILEFLQAGDTRALKCETSTVKGMSEKRIFGNDVEEDWREAKTSLTENFLPT